MDRLFLIVSGTVEINDFYDPKLKKCVNKTLNKNEYLTKNKLTIGLNKPYEIDGKFYVIKINEILEPLVKDLNEAKGIVTSDYQSFLEKEWLSNLKNKYPVVIHKDILYSLGETK